MDLNSGCSEPSTPVSSFYTCPCTFFQIHLFFLRCSPEDGQCRCRPHVTGHSCTEPAPGYFFAPLNFYLYEAEEATALQGLASLVCISLTLLQTPFNQGSVILHTLEIMGKVLGKECFYSVMERRLYKFLRAVCILFIFVPQFQHRAWDMSVNWIKL